MSLAKQEFTDAGRSMLGRAQNGERLTISKIVVGSGVAAVPADLWPLVDPIAEQTPLINISSTRDFGNGTLLIEGNFRSDQVGTPFYLREVGVYAHIASELDRLYSIANVFADPPDFIDPAAPTVQVFKIKLIVDRIPTDQLVVQIGPSEAVSGENIGSDTDGHGAYKDTQGNVLRFKRLAAGSHVEITEDVDEELITIGVKTLHQNLDLYVPQTYPGITDPTTLFPTIQAALDSVADVFIPPDKGVTVHVYSGHFTQAVPINITHPNASQITIQGLDIVALPVTGAITVSGTLPNISVVLNVSSITGIAVNDVVYLHDAPHAQLEACGIVTATRGTPTPNVTVKFNLLNVIPPSSIAALATTKLLFFPSQMVSTIPGTMTYLFNCATGVGRLKNFGMRASTVGTAGGIGLFGDGKLENVAVCNFSIGIGNSNGKTLLFPVCAANGCALGVSVGPAGAFEVQAPTLWQRMSWSGCTTYGMWIVAGAYTGGSGTFTYVCSNATGIRADTQAFFGNSNAPATTGGIVVGFNDKGIVAVALGLVITALNAINAVNSNVTWDCVATAGAQIDIVHNANDTGKYSVDGLTRLNPPNNFVVGPSGGYIHVGTP